jgi:hypothetical protein
MTLNTMSPLPAEAQRQEDGLALLEKVVVGGDLAKLSAGERLT